MRSAPGVTRQGCCARRSRGPSGRDLRDAELAGEISEVCEASRRTCGAPKAFAEPRRRGGRASRRRVARIMRESGRAGTTRGRAKRPEGGARQAAPQASPAPDLVRVFGQVRLSEKITENFRVWARNFFGFGHGRAASFPTCPA